MRIPDYAGGSLVNLVAELEHRLAGASPSPRLHGELAALVPEAPTYVVVLFDGLGDGQLDHPEAAPLRRHRAAALDTVFPTTTTVALSSVATGLPPYRHGLLAYLQWMPDANAVVNTIHWTTVFGEPLDLDLETVLPAPNLWERLAAAGAEPITVQPGHFAESNLSRVLYRGCRFEPAYSPDEIVAAAADLAAEPGRLVFVYVPYVDFAAHMVGQESEEYAYALQMAALIWDRLAARLPGGAVLVGVADHGHADFPPETHAVLTKEDHRGRVLYGDGRAMYVNGDGAALAAKLPAAWVPLAAMDGWWGPGPAHPAVAERAPDGVLIADEGRLLVNRFVNAALIGNHGALTDAELRIPLLVAGG